MMIGIDHLNILKLEVRFGFPYFDWFASEHNTQLPRFYSRFWNPPSLGVDAFTGAWSIGYLFLLCRSRLEVLGK